MIGRDILYVIHMIIKLETSSNQNRFKKFKNDWKINQKKHYMVAYYVPYPYSRSKKLFKSMKVIGRSVKGRPIHMKKIGSGKTKVWLVGQHPGETINSWILEGFVKELWREKCC